MILLLLACTTSPAPTPTAEHAATPATDHASTPHEHTAPHKGIVQSLGDFHAEALIQPGGIMLFLTDPQEQALPVDGWVATAIVKGPKGIENVSFSPMGNHLHGMTTLEKGQPAQIVITLNKDSKAWSAAYNVEAVGMAYHDHTALHNGQVSMWADYHIEYVAKDNTYQFYLTDAWRRPVTGTATGTVKDGDTVIPLQWDAASGALTTTGQDAGRRPVLLEVTIGETSFSLAFNPM